MSQLAQNLNLDAQKQGSVVNTGGINATETGSTDDAVLRFDVAPPTIVGPVGDITVVTTAANGTIVTVNRSGRYFIEFGGATIASGTLHLGISSNVVAAGLVDDPSYAIAGFLEVLQPVVTGAATNNPIDMAVELEVIKGTAALVRFHGTNGADAPPVLTANIASFYYRITRLEDIRGRS